MTQQHRNETVPASRDNRNSEATSLDQLVDRIAFWALLFGELVDGLCAATGLFGLIHPNAQLEMCHQLLTLACLSLHACVHWRSHAANHDDGLVRALPRTEQNPDKSKP